MLFDRNVYKDSVLPETLLGLFILTRRMLSF
jgi:hypothetical protein